MVPIDEAQDILEKVAEGLPEEFYKELNGGIILLPDVRRSREPWGENLYTLGEYIVSHSMGRYIAIYYGSFAYVFGEDASEDKIAKELRKTLLHEFTHHLEDLAGEKDLEKEDERRMMIYKKRAEMRRLRRGGKS
jgi:predicted Zn-dependent protease with MMP-like domain